MATIVKAGTARNLVSVNTPTGRGPDPTEKKFVTFLTDSGTVHTIIADVDHAAKTADDLLKWFEHTRVGVELSASRATSPFFRTAAEVIEYADKAMGFIDPQDNTDELAPTDTTGGGVF